MKTNSQTIKTFLLIIYCWGTSLVIQGQDTVKNTAGRYYYIEGTSLFFSSSLLQFGQVINNIPRWKRARADGQLIH